MKSPAGVKYLVPVAIFSAGLGIGWWGASRNAGKSSAGAIAEETASRSRPPHAANRMTRGGDPTADSAGRALAQASTPEFADSVREIFRETNEDRRMALFDKLLDRASPAHLAELVNLIRENDLKGNASNGEWSRLWARWGETDALGALEFIAAKDWTGWESTAPHEAKKRSMSYWVQTDPQAALAYFEKSGDLEKGDRSLVFPLIRGLANEDPQAAADWMFKTGLGMRDEYRAVVDALCREKGMAGADEWFDRAFSAGTIPQKDVVGIAQALIGSRQSFEPDKAAAWIEAHLDHPMLATDQIVGDTARAWAARDPAATMEWAARTGLKAAVYQSFGQWCNRDLGAATAWLDSNTGSAVYSDAAYLGARAMFAKDPGEAVRIANTITNPQLKDDALRVIAAMQKQQAQSGDTVPAR